MGTLIQGEPRQESTIHRLYDVGTRIVFVRGVSHCDRIPVMV